MEWLLGGGLRGLTLGTYIHEAGVYDEQLEEGRRRGLLSDPKTRNIDICDHQHAA